MDQMTHEQTAPLEYAKFIGVLLFIFFAAWLIEQATGLGKSSLPRLFMAVFFLVFAMFKFLDLPGFATSFMGYDIIARRVPAYAYVYPFIELALALGFFLSVRGTELAALAVSVIGSIGVARQLLRKSKIKCACLGTYIKLPLTTVSLVEDVGMGVMALALLFWK